MTRNELKNYIYETYCIKPDCLWIKYPSYEVFRHADSKKWFAVIMDIPKAKLGLEGEGVISVVNLKNDPIMIGSLRKESGIFPAYHMNKAYWITVVLDGTVEESKIKWLLDMSFDLTKKGTVKK